MRTTTFGIHRGLPNEPVLLAPSHELQAICVLSDLEFAEAFYEDALEF